ncbi:MAG: zf-HC2 protein, partial [Phenylobacterium sp.]|nr:zf-HC2 protein [Phenylobacterium sp.]
RALAGPAGVRWAIAVQAAAVLLVVGLVLPQATRAPQGAYHALSAPAAPRVGDLVVIFRPDATEQDFTRTIREAGARLVDGPTAADAYVLQVPAAGRAAALAQLRAASCVVLAQPIDPAGQP